jgi:hypothetical protein
MSNVSASDAILQYTNSEVFVELQGAIADQQANDGNAQPDGWPYRTTPILGDPPPASLGYDNAGDLGPLVRLIKNTFPLKIPLDPNAVARCKTVDDLVTLILTLV